MKAKRSRAVRNRRLTALEVSLKRGTEMSHLGKKLQAELAMFKKVLTQHHELLESIRCAGLLTDRGSELAVSCLHAYNRVMNA